MTTTPAHNDWKDVNDWRDRPGLLHTMPASMRRGAAARVDYQRRLHQAAPDHAPKAPPSLTVPTGRDIERGSSALPLLPGGVRKLKSIGKHYKGNVHGIVSDSLPRAAQSAQALAETSGAPIIAKDPGLETQRLGGLEGQAADDVKSEVKRLHTTHLDEVPQGMGPYSTAPGESTNHYLHRALPSVLKWARHARDKGQNILAVGHRTLIKATEAYVKHGMPPDYSIDTKEFNREDGAPGDAYRFKLGADGTSAEMHPMDPKDSGKYGTGNLFINRHGLTAWNGEAVGADGQNEEGGSAKNDEKGQRLVAAADGQGMSLTEQARHYQSLRDIMRSPGYTRLGKDTRVKIQNAAFKLRELLPADMTQEKKPA